LKKGLPARLAQPVPLIREDERERSAAAPKRDGADGFALFSGPGRLLSVTLEKSTRYEGVQARCGVFWPYAAALRARSARSVLFVHLK